MLWVLIFASRDGELLTLWQAIAFLAAGVLLLSQFAPEGSRLVETGATDEDEESEETPVPDDSTPLNGQAGTLSRTEQGT